MKEKNNINMKKIIIAAIVLPIAWRLGVYLGLGAIIGGAIGGIVNFYYI